MLQLNHKFIKTQIVVVCFCFLFFYNQRVYAEEVIVNAHIISPFVTTVDVGDQGRGKILQVEANLSNMLNVTTIAGLKERYSKFTLDRYGIRLQLVRASDNHPLTNPITDDDRTLEVDTSILTGYNTIGVAQQYLPPRTQQNELRIYSDIILSQLQNELTLTILLMTEGDVQQGNRITVTANSFGRLTFTRM